MTDRVSTEKAAITPEVVFRYARRYAAKREADGRGTQYPTFRQAAKRFRCSYDTLEQTVSEYLGDGYLGVAVAVGIPGVGCADLPRAEWQIEAYT